MVVNLDYPDLKEQENLLSILREKLPIEYIEHVGHYPPRVQAIYEMTTNIHVPFFIKEKADAKRQISFLQGRTTWDPINKHVRHDFTPKARRMRMGFLNEIILSRKIKALIALPEFQNVVKANGFVDLSFSEPIMAIVDKKSGRKFILYKNYPQRRDSRNFEKSEIPALEEVAKGLRKLFLAHGINPHDLRWEQFLKIVDEQGERLVLTDTEAYVSA